jgi:uncharacterized protein YdeI (YjbR/CyaY-like superfamily)
VNWQDAVDFPSVAAWHTWLEAHHDQENGIWVVIQKKASTAPGLRYEEAVLEAVAYGWIDGKMHRIDDLTFAQRFSPRNPKTSSWSPSNKMRVEKLVAEGRMTPAGMAAVEEAKRLGIWDRDDHDRAPIEMPQDLASALAADREAEAGFERSRKRLKPGE